MFTLTQQTNSLGFILPESKSSRSRTSLFSHVARCIAILLFLVIGQGVWADEATPVTVTFDGNGQTLAVSSLTQPTSRQALLLPAGYTSCENVNQGTWLNAGGFNADGPLTTSVTPTNGDYYESYQTSASEANANVLTQTVTGLDDNYYYEIVMDVAASYTSGRNFDGYTGNNRTVAFAGSGDNEKTVNIPVYDRQTVTSGGESRVVFVVKPTNGSLTFGLKNIAASGNWFVAKVVSFKKITNSSTFLGWYTSDGNCIGGAGDKYTPTDNTTLYAQWSYVNRMTSGYQPTVGGTETIKDNDGNCVLTLTYGGWTHGESSAPNKWEKASGDNCLSGTDSWPAASEVQGTKIDGYIYQSQMNDDARSETKGSVTWEDNNYSKIHPFSLPCRGSYITTVAETNGVMTIYLVQNGTINIDDSNDNLTYKSLSGLPRVYFWFDQNGNVIPASATVTQTLHEALDYRKTEALYADIKSQWEVDPKNDSDKSELATTIRNNWVEAGNVEKAIPYHNGHFLAEKAYIKYVVNMVAGKTYYFFSNNSKMGYAGLNFAPKSEISIAKINANAETVKTESSLALSQETTFSAPSTTTAYKTVTLDRSFTENQWSSICLPFAVSEAQVKKIFGEGTQLIIFDGVSGKTANFKYHVYQDILPGQPYFILPRKTISSETFTNVTIDSDVAVKNNGSDGDETFKFIGTFNSLTLNPYDHFISSDGSIGYNTGSVKLKGYRAYLQNTTSSNSLDSKPVVLTAVGLSNAFDDDNIEDAPTALLQVMIDEGVTLSPVKGVYNLNGQKVSNTTEGLPHGVYIVNGSKICIK